jgi:class 3 adenylate cyclase
MDIGGWLRSLGLERHEAAFRENAIDADILRDVTDHDLEKLGILLGDRRRLLRAIATLDGASAAASSPPPVPSAAAASPTSSTIEASGEYRHVTAMFCDLVDLTGIATQLDAEEWRGLVGAYLDAASTAVTEWGGKVSDKLGDGLIALFGYPVEQESDLQRAAHAARAIQCSLVGVNRKNHRDGNPILAARIAIESSPMVIDAAGARQQVFEPCPDLIAAQLRQSRGPSSGKPAVHLSPKAASSELRSVPRAPRANGIVSARGDGHSMTYHQLIARAVDELDSNTGEARRALYERARHALLAQLRTNKSVLVLANIAKERRALEEAISTVEAEAARELRTEPLELGSAALPGRMAAPGRTPDGGAQVSSALPRRDRARPPSTPLPEDEWPAVLFSARDRLLSVRSSRKKQAVNGLREVVGDIHDLGTTETEAGKAARQAPETYQLRTPQYPLVEGSSRSSRELYPDADDSDPVDYRGQERDHELDSQDELPALKAPEAEEEQKDPSSREGFYRGTASRPNWIQPLPKVLTVSGVTTAATLNDVRVMIERHLPAASQAKEMWRYVSNQLREAALGGDTAEFCSVLEMALSLEGLEWTLK